MTDRIVWGATLLEGFDAAGDPMLHENAGCCAPARGS